MIVGCGRFSSQSEPEKPVEELYTMATNAMQDHKYAEAAEYYEKLKDNYPFSPYAVEAELAVGDALFLDEKYLEAVEAYKEFEALHPRREEIPYVLYKIGMANLKTFVSIDRATTSVQEAYEYFQRTQELFPESPYAEKARKEIQVCRRIMVEHELYLADVFWNMGKYCSAWKRYTFIVEMFPDVPDIAKHAKEKSLSAYFLYRKQESQDAREEIYGTWKNMFRWL